jgi:2-polyprenyl-3-methyl-5-hydroxy-6-metoxy-1,4-benzoquinol methylase
VDIIVCNHVLEHVDDFRAAIRELHRVLKPGGILICSFPMDPEVELVDEDPKVKTESERIQRFGQKDHLRVFGMKAERLLEKAGLQVEKISGEDFEEEILPVVGPADYDMNILFVCKKL